MAQNHVNQFIQSLSFSELKIVKSYLNKSSIGSGRKLNKLLSFLTSSTENFSDTKLSKLMMINSTNLRVLKSRLFSKIKEALLSDDHLENKKLFTEREKTVFKIKKKVILIKILYRTINQGRIETVKILIDETIKMAKENEVYDMLVEILTLKRHIIGIRNGLQFFENISKEICFYEKGAKAIQNAYDIYYQIILNQGFEFYRRKGELNNFLISSITIMAKDYKTFKSHELNYYIHIVKIALYENQKNFKAALKYCKRLLLIVKKSKISFTKDRVGFALGNISIFNVYLGKFNDALLYAQKAQKFHIANSFNYLSLKDQEFCANFYGKNYTDAQNCIDELLKHSPLDAGKFRISKFNCYQAYTLFATSRYKEALQFLNKSLEIEKDKTGWNIALRIVLIMTFIELNKITEANAKISALRKYIQRTGKTMKIASRDLLILKMLVELEKDNFKINKNNKKIQSTLKELFDTNNPTSWNYYTPELIPFHEWVLSLPSKN